VDLVATLTEHKENYQFDRLTEMQLAQQVAAGEPAALDRLIENYGERLRRLIGGLTAWCPEVDDLLQETLLRAWLKSGSYRGESSLETWLSTIAISICRNHFRAMNRWLKHLENYWYSTDKEYRTQPSQFMTEHGETDSQWEQVQNGMKRLNHKDRELLVLVYIQQWSNDEVSNYLKITTEALHVRLHRARNRLREMMGEKTQL
jgi:RNA polymerase sigma-70 factor, ECF subfamily